MMNNGGIQDLQSFFLIDPDDHKDWNRLENSTISMPWKEAANRAVRL